MKLFCNVFTATTAYLSLAAASSAAAASSSSSSSNARLPYSLQKVVADLQQQDNEGEESISTQLTTACLITSQSVTRREKKSLLQALVSDDAASSLTENSSTTTAIGTRNGLILAMPDNDSDNNSAVVTKGSTIVSCGGNVIYYPSAVDLVRGEGLFLTLAPAMEQILASSSSSDNSKPSLVVVVPNNDDNENVVSVEMAKMQLEKAAESVLSHLVVGNGNSNKPLSLLQDVFVGGVHYISKSQLNSDLDVLAALGNGASSSSGGGTTSADAIASRIQQAVAASVATTATSETSTTSMNGNDLASARILGPKSRIVLQECIQSVLSQTVVADDGNSDNDDDADAPRKLILDFGNLVRLSLQQGLDKLDQMMNNKQLSVQSCTVTKQIRQNFVGHFHQGVANELQEQLTLLQEACFEDFKKGLSKLILSPQLASDMDAVGNTAITSFATKAKHVVTGATSQSLANQVYTTAKQEFATKIKQQCASRLLTARANGKFRPLPRKGVTVGMHWLLPKPFGNDYRQEPWMVHATDNMVYVPSQQGKVQNVNPKDVQSGDWKSKITPSPIGNDMIYVQ